MLMSLWISILLVLLLASCGTGISDLQASAIPLVPASEVLSRIAEGQTVYYDGVAIVGDLNLSKLPGARIAGSLELVNCTVSNASFDGINLEKEIILWGTEFGNASFDKASFLAQADLSNTTFRRSSFRGAAFHQPAFFDGAQFLDNVSFVDAEFNQDASFVDALFKRTASFNYSNFDSYTYFTGAQFYKDALFSDVDFSGVLDFSGASFIGKANFFQSRFNVASFGNVSFAGPVQFGLTKFSGLASFGRVFFADEANFNLARFGDAAYFSDSEFQGLALFGLTKFEDISSFQNAVFDDDLNFKGGSIKTILLDNVRYGRDSRIILNNTDFSRFKAHWNEIEGHVVWDPGTYLALVDNYRSMGWSQDEDGCYYRYRSMNQAQKEWGWSKAIDILALLSCGYGVRPGYAASWSLLTIFAFSIVFWKGDGIRRSAKPLHEPAEKYIIPEKVNFKNALFFSTMVFLSRGPLEFLPMGRHKYFVILEGILGWLLLALFLVTLGKVMIR
jgi:uncharacterized protein YjbI with pentapeptide repeats